MCASLGTHPGYDSPHPQTVGLHLKFCGNVSELSAQIPERSLRESPTGSSCSASTRILAGCAALPSRMRGSLRGFVAQGVADSPSDVPLRADRLFQANNASCARTRRFTSRSGATNDQQACCRGSEFTFRGNRCAACWFLGGILAWGDCPIAFVVSLFQPGVRMYEAKNAGWKYDLGFLLGVLIVLGGGGAQSSACTY